VKILYVSQYYPPEMGAPAARVSGLARAWAADGHEVTVLTGFPNHPTGVIPEEYRGPPYIRQEQDRGVKVVRAPIFAAPNKGVVARSISYLSFGTSASVLGPLLPKPDVVIGTSPQFLSAVAGYGIATWHRVPFIFEVRDLWPRSIVEVGAMPAEHPVIKVLEKMETFLYEHAKKIVVVTDGFVDDIAAKGVDRSKFAVVKNGVDLGLFTPGPKQNHIREKYGLGDKFVVGYIGTHGMSQGLGTLLDAAALLKDDPRFQFMLVGEGAEKEALMRRAEEEGITNVLFIGQQPHTEIPNFVRATDVTVVPLRKLDLFKTTIPSKIFEIMGVGRPIVMTVDGEARKIVEDAQAGVFVPPEDPAALAKKLRQFADSPEQLKQMEENGPTFVQEHFSRPALARKYLTVLDEVVHGRKVAAAPPNTTTAESKERAA
jgi:glycosyltransferase involved in cell wall biosynthesis